MTDYEIPRITNARLAELLVKIRPCVRSADRLWYVKPVDARNVSFVWAPRLDGEAKNLVAIETIKTLHGFGYQGFFKPSIAEVLAQIPEALIEATVAFECRGPQDAADLNRQRDIVNAGFHQADTVLYAQGGKKPKRKPARYVSALDRIDKVLG